MADVQRQSAGATLCDAHSGRHGPVAEPAKAIEDELRVQVISVHGLLDIMSAVA